MLGLHKLHLRTYPTGHAINNVFASAKIWPWLRPWLCI